MAHTFTSIAHVVERLSECEYFLGRMVGADSVTFKFELNAFLSASRSVTFVLQKALARVPAFETWYAHQRIRLKNDAAMAFFLELRNVSQKEGPVAYVGGSTLDGCWSYRFVSIGTQVPPSLAGRDIGSCCAEHLQKLATLVLMCLQAFPYHACLARALTEEGMATLGFTFSDVEALLGLPQGYTDIGECSCGEKLDVLRREFEPVDSPELERLAKGKFLMNGAPLKFVATTGKDLVDEVARILERGTQTIPSPRNAFILAVAKRIEDLSK